MIGSTNIDVLPKAFSGIPSHHSENETEPEVFKLAYLCVVSNCQYYGSTSFSMSCLQELFGESFESQEFVRTYCIVLFLPNNHHNAQ